MKGNSLLLSENSPSKSDLLKTMEEAMKIIRDEPWEPVRLYELISTTEADRRDKLVKAAVGAGKSEMEIYYASKGFTPEQTPDRHKK